MLGSDESDASGMLACEKQQYSIVQTKENDVCEVVTGRE